MFKAICRSIEQTPTGGEDLNFFLHSSFDQGAPGDAANHNVYF
jgi:hypothetical protein